MKHAICPACGDSCVKNGKTKIRFSKMALQELRRYIYTRNRQFGKTTKDVLKMVIQQANSKGNVRRRQDIQTKDFKVLGYLANASED